MIAILKFNLSDMDDKESYKDAMNGSKYRYATENLDNYLRNQIKYNGELTEEQSNIYQEIRDQLRGFIQDEEL